MSGFMGAIEGIVGGIEGGLGGGGGGNFLSELLDAFGGSASQSNSGGGSGTMGEIGQIAGDVLPLVAAFL
jgi:hypothetical protein